MTEINSNTNILPNNPMKAHDLLDHLKKVKGNVSWYEFNLRILVAAYPEYKVFKQALEAELAKTKAAADKVTPAPNATTADKPGTTKADKATTPEPATKPATGNTKGKKTAAQLKADAAKTEAEVPGENQTPEQDAEELASIK